MKAIVGRILKPQGVKGEIKVEPLVPNAECFRGFKTLFIEDKPYTVEKIRIHEGYVYLGLTEITDRNTAESMRDKEIQIEKTDLPKLEKGQYYINDLEDCVIYFENGEKLGKVTEVNNYGASDVLTIMDGSEEVLCPFLPFIFVDVDIKNKKIIADKKHFLEVTQGEV